MSAFTFDNSGIQSLLSAMTQTKLAQQNSLLRLSTGNRINKASDDPSGLIALQNLGAELKSVQAASANGTRASAMLNTADGAMQQISSLMEDIQGLTTELASGSGLTSAEKQAKQLQIDEAVGSINRLVNSTTFNGKQLLNGSMGIQTAGVDGAKITDVALYSRSPASATSLKVDVTAIAERGQLTMSGATLSAGAATVQITGANGTATLSFASGATIASIASAINANKATTGVEAAASGGVLYMRSEEYGADQFVTIKTISGTFATTGGLTNDEGKDATVKVNGQSVGVSGRTATFNVSGISGSLELSTSFITTASGTETFTVKEGGATFSLSPNAANTFTVGLNSMTSSSLGTGTLGYLADIVSGGSKSAINNASDAVKIANAAANQVARARGSLGAFDKYTVGSMNNYLSKAEESLSSAISTIGDTDYAMETAALTRQSIMMQAQYTALSMFGQSQSSLIQLLGGLG
jgi:flagellin